MCGEWLPQVKRNSCQNVNIVLLVDKHATYTLWDLKQVSGLFFFFFLCQPAAWPCVAISWDIKQITRNVCWKYLVRYMKRSLCGTFLMWWEISLLFGALAPQKSSTLALESVMAPMNRAGADLIRNELQTKTNCPYANVDGFVDTNDVSSLG